MLAVAFFIDIQTNVFELFLRCKNIIALDRSLLVELVEMIYVHEDKKVIVVFRFSDEMERVMAFVEGKAQSAENE